MQLCCKNTTIARCLVPDLSRKVRGVGIGYVLQAVFLAGFLHVAGEAGAQRGVYPSGDLSGQVTDRRQQPLVGATVLLLPDSLYCATDAEGRFGFGGLDEGSYRLEISYVGYRTLRSPEFAWPGALPALVLDESTALLEAVVVAETHDHLEDALATAHLNRSWLEETDRSTLAAALEREPGMAVIRTGIGITKPVIRGLSGQRIIVQDHGIKQEGQQWGTDHGLEIDPFAVDRVELIKGPGSLLYGSDGLGGVLRILPAALPPEDRLSAGVEAVYRSANQHIGGTAWLGYRRKGFFVSGRYSHQDFADMQVPADSFVFQGFRLPIPDGYLKNTAGRETAVHLTAGRVGPRSLSRLYLSRYHLEAGLFSGAVGIPRSYALTPDGSRRNTEFPSQSVEHWKLAWNHRVDLGADLFSLDLGLQRNIRREFSFPEFHSLPSADPGETLALELDLWTASLNLHYDQHMARNWSATYGLDLQSQVNRAGGFETLLPGYNLLRGGVYAVAFRELDARSRLTLGLRLDAGANDSEAQQRYVYSFSGEITDSLGSPALRSGFGNYSLGIGYNREWPASGWLFRIHGGKSFRLPHPAETVSNGVHHGTFRHEQGNPELRSEHGYQADAGLEWEGGTLSLALSGFFNFFDGYIYLTPSGQLSALPEAGQIFRYQQHDAVFAGGEFQLFWKPVHHLQAELSADCVFNYNLETTLPLPFTPPPSIRHGWRYARDAGGVLRRYSASMSARYRAAQNRVDRNEPATPDNLLLEASVSGTFRVGTQEWELQLQAFNLLNTAYLDHLSRYRWINVPEPGRNLALSLRVPLDRPL